MLRTTYPNCFFLFFSSPPFPTGKSHGQYWILVAGIQRFGEAVSTNLSNRCVFTLMRAEALNRGFFLLYYVMVWELDLGQTLVGEVWWMCVVSWHVQSDGSESNRRLQSAFGVMYFIEMCLFESIKLLEYRWSRNKWTLNLQIHWTESIPHYGTFNFNPFQ